MLMNSRGGPLFGAVCWWILEADPLLGAVCWWILEAAPLLGSCMLMNSRGGPPSSWWNLEADRPLWLMNSRGGSPFLGCMLMNSRSGPPHFERKSSSRDNFYGSYGPLFITHFWALLQCAVGLIVAPENIEKLPQNI